MTREGFNAYCAGFPGATHVVQWGNADVWKVGGKVFAIGGWAEGRDAFTFKVSDLAFEVLTDRPGIHPAPYMASRGLKWVQHHAAPGLPEPELRDHIAASYDMIAAKLPRRTRKELGMD